MSETEVKVQDEKQDIGEVATEEKQSVDQVPYARFKELITEKNELKVQLDSMNSEIKKQSEDRKMRDMEAKGEYDKIMSDMTTKLESAETRAKAFDEYQATRRESLLSKLPEDDRAIYDGLSLEKLEVHVDKVSQKPNPVNVDNSKPSQMGGYGSYEEWATLDPKGYKKANDSLKAGKIKIGYGS